MNVRFTDNNRRTAAGDSSLLVKTFIGSARIFSRNYPRGSFTLFHSFGIDAP